MDLVSVCNTVPYTCRFYMTSRYFFFKFVVLVFSTGAKNYHEIFSEKSRIGGKSALTSQIFNHTEGSWSSFRKINLH